MNRVLITGRLTRDPELRTTAGGKAVAQFTDLDDRAPSCQEAGAGIWSANTWVRSGVVMGSSSTILPSASP